MQHGKNKMPFYSVSGAGTAMLGRKQSVVGVEHSLLATDFGDEGGVETGERDWMNR